MKKEKNSILREIFSASNGYLSSKRILGALVLIACTTMIIVEACRNGITDNVKSLFEWLIITSTALLGITSVTNIWKQKAPKSNIEEKTEIE